MDRTGVRSWMPSPPPEAQKRFLSYEFSVDLLVDATDADVLDVFARINSYSLPLNEQEKRNAKFFGAFKQFVYELGWNYLEFWKGHGILTDKSIARMREAELTSELLIAMVAGLQDKKTSLNSFYEKWDERSRTNDQFRINFEIQCKQSKRYLGRLWVIITFIVQRFSILYFSPSIRFSLEAKRPIRADEH